MSTDNAMVAGPSPTPAATANIDGGTLPHEQHPCGRPYVHGKFLYVGQEKLYLRGVTYGPFRPDESGCEYHKPEVVEKDFATIRRQGVNAVRTYTVPPRWLLDIALTHDLHVLAGLPWEQVTRLFVMRQQGKYDEIQFERVDII